MNPLEIIRAWKDEEYLMSLGETERAALPENPAGVVELDGAELEGQAGGKPNPIPAAAGCVPKTHSLLCYASRPINACPGTHPTLRQLCGTFLCTRLGCTSP